MYPNGAIPLISAAVAGALFLGYLAETAEPYFPLALQTQPPGCAEEYPASLLTAFEADWYATGLRGLGERPLFPAAADDTIVRFTWLRSFHSDITVRAETRNDGRVRLHARRGPPRRDDAPGCTPSGEGCEMTRLLTGSEALRLTRARQAVLAGPVRDCRWGLDGARWIVESVDHGDYRFAHDWSPQEGAVRELGLLMLEFTGWEVEPVY